MKLDRQTNNANRRSALRQAIERLREGCSNPDAPCLPNCPQPNDRHCAPDCPGVIHALSSAPDTDPLEAGIAPLVYQLKKLDVLQPFWSCEGHLHPNGSLWKVPRVWFYTDDVVHVRVLAECLTDLCTRKQVTHPWQVAATFCERESTGAAFAIEPVPGSDSTLPELQADARRIAMLLPEGLEKQMSLLEKTGR